MNKIHHTCLRSHNLVKEEDLPSDTYFKIQRHLSTFLEIKKMGSVRWGKKPS